MSLLPELKCEIFLIFFNILYIFFMFCLARREYANSQTWPCVLDACQNKCSVSNVRQFPTRPR